MQISRELRVQQRSGKDEDAGHDHVRNAAQVLSELIRRRDADPRKDEQRRRDAEV